MNKLNLRNLRFQGMLLLVAGVAIGVNALANHSAAATVAAAQGQPKWEVSAMPDVVQFRDPSVPVAVFNVASGIKEAEAGAAREFQVKEVIVENHSAKAVSSVTLRWLVTPLNARTTVLKQGELNPHALHALSKTLPAGQRQTLKLSFPRIGQMIRTIPDADSYTGFAVIIGVSKIVFDDGSTWEEQTEVTKQAGPGFAIK